MNQPDQHEGAGDGLAGIAIDHFAFDGSDVRGALPSGVDRRSDGCQKDAQERARRARNPASGVVAGNHPARDRNLRASKPTSANDSH